MKLEADDEEGYEKKVCVVASLPSGNTAEVSYKLKIEQRSKFATEDFESQIEMSQGDYFDLPEASTGFQCGMKGYKELVQEIVDLMLFIIPMIKEIAVAIMPEDLGLAIDHFYLGLTGASLWIGYVVAAVYYMAADQGYGEYMCEASGYGWIVVDTLHVMVDWEGEEEEAE